nr:type I 3-dehydroquinate dehydratase [Gimesia benthica]
MICISVTPESRNFAKVDILNAAAQCDLVELCLDRLIKTPDIGDLISGFEVPILVSCRHPEEGGSSKARKRSGFSCSSRRSSQSRNTLSWTWKQRDRFPASARPNGSSLTRV